MEGPNFDFYHLSCIAASLFYSSCILSLTYVPIYFLCSLHPHHHSPFLTLHLPYSALHSDKIHCSTLHFISFSVSLPPPLPSHHFLLLPSLTARLPLHPFSFSTPPAPSPQHCTILHSTTLLYITPHSFTTLTPSSLPFLIATLHSPITTSLSLSLSLSLSFSLSFFLFFFFSLSLVIPSPSSTPLSPLTTSPPFFQ